MFKKTLQNGHGTAEFKVPDVGLGCWKLRPEVCADVVERALNLGYRHIDCAGSYGNDAQIGVGLHRAFSSGVCSRGDVHVTSKLWNTYHAEAHVELAARKTLSEMGLDYLDLYLVHFPISLKFVPFEERYPTKWPFDPDSANPRVLESPVPMAETWAAMERLVDQGLVRSIGVSNFNCQSLRDLLSYARIKPAVLQVELHPYLQQSRLVRFAQSHGLHVTAFSPLGHGDSYQNNPVSTLKDPVIRDIADKHNKTPAQVSLRWNLERGCSVIPKSEHESRLADNLAALSFRLDESDVARIDALDRRYRFNDPGELCERTFGSLAPIFD